MVLALFLVLTPVFSLLLGRSLAIYLTPSTWLLPDSYCFVAFTFILEAGDLTAPEFHKQNENKLLVFSFPFLLGCFRMVSWTGKMLFYTLLSTEVPLENFYCHIFHAPSW